jgi:hypothetical protein
MAQQATTLAGFTFANYVASIGVSREFIMTHTGAPIDGNLSSSEVGSVSVSDIVTISGVSTAIAQVVYFIPLSPTLGESYQAFINGSGATYTVSSTGTTIQDVVE